MRRSVSCSVLFDSEQVQPKLTCRVMPEGRIRPKYFPEGTLLTFVVLAINIATTIGAVAFPEILVARQVVFGVLLVLCFPIFVFYMVMKHGFLAFTKNVKPWCKFKKFSDRRYLYCCLRSCCSWSMVYDVVFCVMALLYLLGDNLEMACKKRYCPVVGRVLTGTSLMLNIFLQLLKASNSGAIQNLPTLPAIGKMGNIYSKMLYIAALALTIDQSLTTILQSVDIEIANDTINVKIVQGSTLIVDNMHKAQVAASGIMVFLFGIAFVLVVFVLALLACANNHVCCDFKCKNVEWYELVCEWLCGFSVAIFVILFSVGDIDWIWNFFDKGNVTQPATIVRLSALIASLILLCILSLVYICGICIPGLGVGRGVNSRNGEKTCWMGFCDFRVLLCDLLKDRKSWKRRLVSAIDQTLWTVQDVGGEIDELVGSGRGDAANGTSDSLLNRDPTDNMGSSSWTSYGSAPF